MNELSEKKFTLRKMNGRLSRPTASAFRTPAAWGVYALMLVTLSAHGAVHAVRVGTTPILTPASSPTLGDNLNGPSLVRVPDWIEKPLGRYYLYFANHHGTYIRLAYANRVAGPWKVYEPGTLQLKAVSHCHGHIASPDVLVDEQQHQVRMYFHCPAEGTGQEIEIQKTFVALSRDGLHFSPVPTPLGPAYFRVFHWRDHYYALARAGVFLRSADGIAPFDNGPTLFNENPNLVLRHAAVDVEGNRLAIYYSRIGDRPERILLSYIRLTPDWTQWKPSPPVTVISPETKEEGVDRPLETSKIGEAEGRVRELRDPAIFHDGDKTYLLYSIAGESGLAIAELMP